MLFLILSIKLQKMPRKVWVYSPKKARPKISPQIKEEIKNICDEFIESKLKPSYVKEFNPHIKEQQRVDIYCKWYQHYVHFVEVFKDTRDNVIAPEYEYRFFRLQYLSSGKLIPAYFRNTGQWQDLRWEGASLEHCLKEMEDFSNLY